MRSTLNVNWARDLEYNIISTTNAAECELGQSYSVLIDPYLVTRR
jgi:predicted nuclease of restriction endonuclease-like (RecB) superfamily